MLEQLKYKNHINEVFEFGKDGIFVNINDLHDYEWKVSKKNNRISSLDYSISKRKLPVIIFCKSEEAGTAARNRLMEVFEKDVLAMQHGKIIIGDYYFKCFVTKSQKRNYLINNRYMALTLTLTSDFPFWVKETTQMFRDIRTETGGKSLDYDFDYPFDYFNSMGSKNLANSGFVDTNFKMIIYGACSNPSVNIAGHIYQVNCDVEAGEYLTIDSASKKIFVTANDGTTKNVFNLRNKNSYIFKKIQPGNSVVTWAGNFGVDITLFEERSEPKWI